MRTVDKNIKEKNYKENFITKLWLEKMADNPFEAILIIDKHGFVQFVNSFCLKLLNLHIDEVIGKDINDLMPECKLFQTVLEEHSTWGERLILSGKEVFVGRFPIKNKGETIGAVVKTIFPDMSVAKSVANTIINPNNKDICRSLATCRDIIGESSSMSLVKKLARRAARTDSTLLITGESGTGKGLLAQAIHNRSVRKNGPFISVNCAAIPENLLESEMFGYVDGAFTGARRGGKPGKFELAEGGTIFLDEVGDMSLSMQAKFLRVLEEKEIERIGSNISIRYNIRVIAATHQNLKKMVKEGKFREDLYYRLKVLEIIMPPLRNRIEDLPDLIEELIHKINKRIGSNARAVNRKSFEIMKSYSWPGNIRELENILEQAINWSDEPVIDLREQFFGLEEHSNVCAFRGAKTQGYHDYIDKVEKKLISEALAQTNGNKTKAAKLLNMNRSVLYKKMDKLGM